MTTRLLQGAQRTGPGVWQWGCWEITRFGENDFWMATDTQTDFGMDPDVNLVMDRVRIATWCRLSVLRWFLWDLAATGPAPLTADQVRKAQEER
jgi:hypothetical protein